MNQQNTLEKEVEQHLREIIKQHGGLCLKWVCPGWSGVPDRIILLPGGKVIFCELKRPKGGKISKLQEWWHNKLRSLGFWVLYIFDHDQVNYLSASIQNMLEERR